MSYQGLVISDLHLFRAGTDPEGMLLQLVKESRHHDFLVMNGDIFDFRWTRFASIEETEQRALEWLKELASQASGCRIFYLLGNNDCHQQWVKIVDQTMAGYANFQWFASCLRIDDAFFCHGDIPVFFPFLSPYVRRLRPVMKRKPDWFRTTFETLIHPWFMKLSRRVFCPRRSSRNVRFSLRKHPHSLSEGIQRVFYGHIHLTFEELQLGRLTFFNTGAVLPWCDGGLLKLSVRTFDPRGQ